MRARRRRRRRAAADAAQLFASRHRQRRASGRMLGRRSTTFSFTSAAPRRRTARRGRAPAAPRATAPRVARRATTRGARLALHSAWRCCARGNGARRRSRAEAAAWRSVDRARCDRARDLGARRARTRAHDRRALAPARASLAGAAHLRLCGGRAAPASEASRRVGDRSAGDARGRGGAPPRGASRTRPSAMPRRARVLAGAATTRRARLRRGRGATSRTRSRRRPPRSSRCVGGRGPGGAPVEHLLVARGRLGARARRPRRGGATAAVGGVDSRARVVADEAARDSRGSFGRAGSAPLTRAPT